MNVRLNKSYSQFICGWLLNIQAFSIQTTDFDAKERSHVIWTDLFDFRYGHFWNDLCESKQLKWKKKKMI